MNNLILFTLVMSLMMVMEASGQVADSISTNYKDNNIKNRELKLNAAYVIRGYSELAYEQLFTSSNTSLGLSLGKSFVVTGTYSVNLSVVPYYRIFFGTGNCEGFFLESSILYLDNFESDKSRLGGGFAVGSKFLNQNGFVFELLFGISRAGPGLPWESVFPRAGLFLGKRFW